MVQGSKVYLISIIARQSSNQGNGESCIRRSPHGSCSFGNGNLYEGKITLVLGMLVTEASVLATDELDSEAQNEARSLKSRQYRPMQSFL